MPSDGNENASRESAAPRRRRSFARSAAVAIGAILVAAIVLEAFLRVADFRNFRLMPEPYRIHQHDPEIGWVPVPNKIIYDGSRINSIGLRDIELAPTAKPTILFVGDSFVFGNGVKDGERFTDRLREALPDFQIVNAGVQAYGTDQAFLLMRRLWPRLEPSVVVLTVCVENDHRDNATNSVHRHTLKPYLAQVDGAWRFQGTPVPRNHAWYYYNDWLASHSALVRLILKSYMHVRYPAVTVPDPTAQLVIMMRDYVAERGAKFLVGLQHADPALEPTLQAQGIPYARMDGAPIIPNDGHWNPQGHATVAARLLDLLAAEKLIEARAPSQ
jgi:hypothetical protein